MEGSTPVTGAVQARAAIDDDDSRSSFEHSNIIESETLLYDSAKQIVEYEWPENSGEFHFIEEYLVNYLGIKSMRRAYPKLERRHVVDKLEKHYLRLNMMVNDLQCHLGVIAIPSQQVLKAVFPNHKEKFEAYQHVKQTKKYGAMVETMRKQNLIATKSYLESPEQLRMNSLRACADWNAGLNKQVSKRRSATQSEYKQVYPIGDQLAPSSKMGYFPVAVLPGQHIDTPRRYSSEELKHYPLNTVLRGPPKSACTRHTPAASFSKNKKSPTKYLDASALHDVGVVCSVPSFPLSTVLKDSVESRDPSPSGSPASTDSNGSSLFELVLLGKKKKDNVEAE